MSILTAAAEEGPALCVVDDAHWLDAATAGALLFCAHRLGADRVALAFAARDGIWGSFDPQGLSSWRWVGSTSMRLAASCRAVSETARWRTWSSGSWPRPGATRWRCWCSPAELHPTS